jgi:hypothetical protein
MLTAAQGRGAEGGLVQQLQAAYVPTVMDASGIKVARAGATLVVKMEGIQANPAGLGYYGNDYEDGKITAGAVSGAVDTLKGKMKDRIKMPWGGGKVDKKVDSVALAVDDKVYLTKMEIKPASVDLYVQTCGTCDPAAADPAHHPHLAKVSVHLVNGFLNATDFSHVQQAIASVLAVPEADAGQDAQAQPQPQEAPAAQAEAPAQGETPQPPPAEPVRIEVGQTPDQVVAALGTPEKIVKLDSKQIYIYRDLKVTFVKEKVVNVE